MDHMNALALVLLLAAPSVPSDGIIHVTRGSNRAHACAVRSDILLTAKHVVDDAWKAQVAWSDLTGNDGTAFTVDTDPARDLAVLVIERGAPSRVWPLAKVAPQRGDRVWIVGYDDDDRDPAKPRIVEAKVVAVDAGLIYYSRSALGGSSGSCVQNDAGEVVAINCAHAERMPGQVRWAVGVSVWGAWAPELPEREVE